MKWRKHLTGKKGDEKMKQRKICKHETCQNDAPKVGDYCAKHRPKTKGTYVSKNGCHTGNVLVFTTPEGIEVYGGGSSRQGGWWLMNPLPDVAIGPSEIVSKGHRELAGVGDHEFPEGWKASNTRMSDIPTAVFSIDWPDYSIPRGLGREFWLALVEDIYTKGVKTVSCQCMGGHGRTGVQLAILAHYLLPESQHTWKDAGQLIDWVREHMCVHEVEAQSQQTYIAEVCDLPVGDMRVESNRWGGYGGGWGHHYASFNTQSAYKQVNDSLEDDDDFDDWVFSKETGWSKKDDSELTDPEDRIFECLNCDAQEVIGVNIERDSNGEIPCITCQCSNMIDVTDVGVGKIDLTHIKEQDKKQESE
mgnify:FL=1